MKLFILTLTVLFSAHSNAERGAGGSGGGGAYFCQGSPTQAFLLDLWEAENLLGVKNRYEIDYSDKDDEILFQAERAIKKLEVVDSEFYLKVSDALKFVMDKKNQRDTDEKIEVLPPTDANPNIGMPGCPLKGLMYFIGKSEYIKSDIVLINRNVYNALINNTHKAAIWVHEAVYKVLRDGVPSVAFLKNGSEGARRLTACLFSKKSCWDLRSVEEKVKEDNPNGYPTYECKSEGFHFYTTKYPIREKVRRWKFYVKQAKFPIYRIRILNGGGWAISGTRRIHSRLGLFGELDLMSNGAWDFDVHVHSLLRSYGDNTSSAMVRFMNPVAVYEDNIDDIPPTFLNNVFGNDELIGCKRIEI